jgi:hypothetical protein
VARELVRLPRGNQAAAAGAAVRHSLTSRQTARLVGVLLATEPAQRRCVLANPLAHLPAPGAKPGEPAKDPRLGEQGNRIRQQLLRLHAATNRLQELLLEPTSLTTSERDLLGGLAAPILTTAQGSLARLEAWLQTGAGGRRAG